MPEESTTNATPKPCNHEGHYRSAGVVSIPGREEILLMTLLYCKKCGAVVGKDLRIKGLAVARPAGPVNLSGIGRRN